MNAWPPLEDLIPHRAPSLLLDHLLELSPTHCLARVHIEPGAWYMQPDGTAPAWMGLEWMAQAASAFSGHRHRLQGREPRIGFLLGTRSYEVFVPSFPAGEAVDVEAEAIFLDESGLGAFSCVLRRHGGEILARARLKAIELP